MTLKQFNTYVLILTKCRTLHNNTNVMGLSMGYQFLYLNRVFCSCIVTMIVQ